jgi:chromosome segregation ATPase
MDWKGIAGIALACVLAGFLSGLVLGARGCQSQNITKLLQQNAELKGDVSRYRFLAKQAEDERAMHAERRHTAERALAAIEAKQVVSTATIKDLRFKVAKAGRKRDERNDLIDALTLSSEEKDEQINWLKAALDASKEETTSMYSAEQALNKALIASEERADKLESHMMKDRKKKIAIGTGSAVGGILLTFGATYAATRVR